MASWDEGGDDTRTAAELPKKRECNSKKERGKRCSIGRGQQRSTKKRHDQLGKPPRNERPRDPKRKPRALALSERIFQFLAPPLGCKRRRVMRSTHLAGGGDSAVASLALPISNWVARLERPRGSRDEGATSWCERTSAAVRRASKLARRSDGCPRCEAAVVPQGRSRAKTARTTVKVVKADLG